MDVQKFSSYLLSLGIEKNTRIGYSKAIQTILFAGYSLEQEDLQAFLLHKIQDVSPSSYNKYVKALKHYCRFQGVEVFPFLKNLKEKPKERILLTDQEMKDLLTLEYRHGRKYNVFWAVLMYTGARPGEVCGLRSEHIDVAAGVIYFHKTKTTARKVPITSPLQDILYPYIKTLSTDWLFPNTYFPDQPLVCSAYMRDWKRRLASLGIQKRVQPYSLRHSFLTGTLGAGANLLDIQDVVGHTDANVTKLYYHKNIERMRMAAMFLPIARSAQEPEEVLEGLVESIQKLHLDKSKFECMFSNQEIRVWLR